MDKEIMFCISCDGDGNLVFGNGKTIKCIRCNGTGNLDEDEE